MQVCKYEHICKYASMQVCMLKNVIGEAKTAFTFVELNNIENHYYGYYNIFQMVYIPDHANDSVNYDIIKLHYFFCT